MNQDESLAYLEELLETATKSVADAASDFISLSDKADKALKELRAAVRRREMVKAELKRHYSYEAS